jgi:hypothetical protein
MAQKVHKVPKKALKARLSKIWEATLREVDETRPAQAKILLECLAIARMLLGKNRRYGNSALEPMRIFSKLSAEEGINVRLDDKLSRIARGVGENEDPELDIVGYLILKRIGKCQKR